LGWKQARHWTGLPEMGSKGTVVSTPQLLQMAGYMVRGAIVLVIPEGPALGPPAGAEAGLGAGRPKRRADEDFFL
jgi:hypothetical protein